MQTVRCLVPSKVPELHGHLRTMPLAILLRYIAGMGYGWFALRLAKT